MENGKNHINQNNDNKNTDSRNLSPANTADPKMEKLAARVVKVFTACCTKLKELKPEIEQIRDWFLSQPGSKTLAGCRSFKEFCETKLNRTEQAVYAMLGDYSAKSKKAGGTGSKKKSQQSTSGQSSLSHEDEVRLRTGANAAVRYFEGQEAGDSDKADEAKKEFMAISKMDSIHSIISGDQPNYRLLLIDLLSEVAKVGDRLPVPLTRMCQAIRNRLGIDDASFGLTPEDRGTPNSVPAAPLSTAAATGSQDASAGSPENTATVNTLDAIGDDPTMAVAADKKKMPEQARSAQADTAVA